MSYMHPAAVEHLRKRWTRPDAYRFARPGTPEARRHGHLHSWAAVARAEEVRADAERAEQDAFEREVLALRHEIAKIRLDYELRRFQQKYGPDQPRAPAGSGRESGRWTDFPILGFDLHAISHAHHFATAGGYHDRPDRPL